MTGLPPFWPPSQPADILKSEDDVVEWVRIAGPLGLTSVEVAAMDSEISGTAPSAEWWGALLARLVATARLRDSGTVRAGRRVVVSVPPFSLEAAP